MITEHIRAYTRFEVARWDADQSSWLEDRATYGHRRVALRRDWFRVAADHFGVMPYLVTAQDDCNLVTLAGWAALLGGIAGTTIATKYTATSARIGIGTSAATATPGMTFLTSDTGTGSTTSYFQLVSTAPAISTALSPATLVFTASFGGTIANFAWNEFGVDNGAASGVTGQGLGLTLLNAGQSPQGTKPSGETWIATVTMSFGYPASVGVLS